MRSIRLLKHNLLVVLAVLAGQATSTGQELAELPVDIHVTPEAKAEIAASIQAPSIHGVIPTASAPATYHYKYSTVVKKGSAEIPHVSLQAIYCGTKWKTAPYSTNLSKLEKYLPAVVKSNYMSALSVYGCDTGTATGGLYAAFTTLPHWTQANQVFLNDSDIQAWLQYYVKNGNISPNNQYVMYIEPGVAIKTSDGSTSIKNFLGYHGFTNAKTPQGKSVGIAYLVLPYPGFPNVTSASQNFKSDFDQLTAVTSHEIAETATDYNPGSGWIEVVKQYDSSNNLVGTYNEEIGDVTLILFSYNYSKCYCRYNGYLVQKCIAKNGNSVLSYPGSTAPDTIYSSVAAVINEKLDILGIESPLP